MADKQKKQGGLMAQPWMPELAATAIVLPLASIAGGSAYLFGADRGLILALTLMSLMLWPFLADQLNPEQRERSRRKREGR